MRTNEQYTHPVDVLHDFRVAYRTDTDLQSLFLRRLPHLLRDKSAGSACSAGKQNILHTASPFHFPVTIIFDIFSIFKNTGGDKSLISPKGVQNNLLADRKIRIA